LANKSVQQVVSAEKLPQAYYEHKLKDLKIDRPNVEVEVPDFIALAEELLEQAQEAERIRINRTPVPVFPPSYY